jgi:hypothetical protein
VALVLLLLAALEVRGIDMGERLLKLQVRRWWTGVAGVGGGGGVGGERLLKLQVRGRGGGGSFPGGGGAWVGWNRQSMKWQVQQLS